MQMRRIALFALFALAACKPEAAAPAVQAASTTPAAAAQKPLRVGATRVPHAELLRAIAPELKAQGVELELREFDDYNRANTAVARGELDANFFQTEPYLWRWRAAHGAPLIVVGRVHVEPMALYSGKLKSLNELVAMPAGQVIAVPDDAANLGRALFLLEHAGLLKLDDRRGLDAGLADIIENAHQLKLRPEPAQKVADQLGSTAAVVLNGNFALQANLSPASALYAEGADSPFPNVVVAREDHAADPRLKALTEALRSAKARELMQQKYAGAVVPAQ
jgi:D-methionine transport system substrate-binding protein